ncbi:prepilin peptidase [Tsukamurella ocularis]|uniref:prepilin peptidase n=1 Tax=Tsukamurella ocularis TaxID=1970234 RepID=UPI002169394C|nr:A24 family peptidase [Tsukamurella ocularis]MCS3779940.1 leader peptidase (prepilin peptidase)/N-methyltransferase [Tsukamurella ocularis]MCS3788660.1 leader peptidase (prepilin peptidase)/N-methyltransferase [Tsukamurella ocularis]MCS3849870.1 leader peptidase (prepilin peptidase)/N-methyltransferase [Tsukamurella ocularis]
MEWGLFGGVFLAWCAALCWFDVRERRLPNVLTLPAACVALVGSLWAVFDGAPAPLVGAVLWAAVNGAAFLALGMGAGDVKLAPPLGAAVAWCGGVPAVLLAVLGAQVLTLAWALVARDRTVPHGPPMMGAALAAAVFAG